MHSVCYTVSDKKNMVVTYEEVPSVDMFQVFLTSCVQVVFTLVGFPIFSPEYIETLVVFIDGSFIGC